MLKPELSHPRPSGELADAVAQKCFFRQALLAERDALPPAERRASDRAICAAVLALPAFQTAKKLLLYAPVGSEIDLFDLIEPAKKAGMILGLPVCKTDSKTLIFREFSSPAELVPGKFGIPVPPNEPKQILPDRETLCLLPALAYDRKKRRIGYGGGYYDRFLEHFPGTSVGVCYQIFLHKSVYALPHDLPVQILVTEQGVWHEN